MIARLLPGFLDPLPLPPRWSGSCPRFPRVLDPSAWFAALPWSGSWPHCPSLVWIHACTPLNHATPSLVMVWILTILPLVRCQIFPCAALAPDPLETFPTTGSFPYRFHARHYRPVFAPFRRLCSNMDKLSRELSDRPHRAHISLPGLSCAAVPRIFSPVCFPGSHLDL